MKSDTHDIATAPAEASQAALSRDEIQMPDLTPMRAEARPKCVLCGSDGEPAHFAQNDRLFGAAGSWNFRKCPTQGCGLMWLDPMPLTEDLFKAYSTYYTHAPAGQLVREGRAKRVYRWIKRGYLANKYGYSDRSTFWSRCAGYLLYLAPLRRGEVDMDIRFLHARHGGRLLDLGCGTGEWMLAMQERGWQVEGLDFDPNAVRVARSIGLDVHCGALEERNLAADSFDVVTLNHVIEHVPDPVGLLRECRRILKPDGKLVLATPNTGSLGHSYLKADWRGLEPPRHLHLFSRPAMERLLSAAGFYQVCVNTLNSHYVWKHSFLLRMAGRGERTSFWNPNRWLLPIFFTFVEQLWLKVSPTCGECIAAEASKPSK